MEGAVTVPLSQTRKQGGQLPNITKGVYLNPSSLTLEPTLLASALCSAAQRIIDERMDG